MTLAELDRDERAALSYLREKRNLTTAQYRAERRAIEARFAGERDRIIRNPILQKEKF